jgi:pyruvate dehydrogenase E2 component (dihydrolipoamide acetyltransferase)
VVTVDPRDPNDDAVLPWRRRSRPRRANFASPVVKRLAALHDIDLRSIAGTGRHERVTRDDVLAAVEDASPHPDLARGDSLREHEAIVPLSPLRRAIADHLTRAQASVAHSHVVVACDYTNVQRVRRGAGLTALPFVARAVVDALADFPLCNATVGDDHLVAQPSVHLGIAVDLDFQGLVVPVIRGADRLRLRALAREIADSADRARTHRLVPDDVAGGTFTITNPGSFGTFVSFPIVNHPQAAILATDSVRKRVVTVGARDGLAIRRIGMLSLGFDHRAMDGAYAAAFVGRVRDVLEQRDWDAEL